VVDGLQGVDGLGLYLTGGSSNTDPDLSLGGVISSKEVRGLGPIISNPIPAMRIDQVMAANGEGIGLLSADASGDLTYTPPGGSAGSSVSIAAGETKIVSGADVNKALRVFRESGLSMVQTLGGAALNLRIAMNGVLAQANVANADRVAGLATYRALMLSAHGPFGVLRVRIWLPPVAGLQSTFAIGLDPVIGSPIQTIVDEETAPIGVSFSSPTTEGAALTVQVIGPGNPRGLWIRRTFPAAGVVSALEKVQMALKYEGAT
jgi:hypothetical protein